jgi:hypothetical protein
MSRTALYLILFFVAAPMFGARQVTVAQLERRLAELKAKPDGDAALAIGELQLTERLSEDRLKTLDKELPGEKSRAILLAVADESGLMPPPAAEIPDRLAPDIAEQKRILALTVEYVKDTIPRLPNFLASRVTERFEDTPQILTVYERSPYRPLHSLGTDTAAVTYRNGLETVSATGQPTTQKPHEGLNSWGAFGPVLGVVLLDAARSHMEWGRWEQVPDGFLAVFRYSVPKANSHYEVNYCCMPEVTDQINHKALPFRQTPAYHGEIAVDPATGAILRLIVQADMKDSDPVVKADILVEYGKVEIGGKTYVCPVHSVSASLAQSLWTPPGYQSPNPYLLRPLKTSVSDIVFRDYHVFRAEARVVPSVQ